MRNVPQKGRQGLHISVYVKFVSLLQAKPMMAVLKNGRQTSRKATDTTSNFWDVLVKKCNRSEPWLLNYTQIRPASFRNIVKHTHSQKIKWATPPKISINNQVVFISGTHSWFNTWKPMLKLTGKRENNHKIILRIQKRVLAKMQYVFNDLNSKKVKMSYDN